MIIFILATIPSLLLSLSFTGMLTWWLRVIGMSKRWCVIYFLFAAFCMFEGDFTTDVPVGQTVYGVIGISQDAY